MKNIILGSMLLMGVAIVPNVQADEWLDGVLVIGYRDPYYGTPFMGGFPNPRYSPSVDDSYEGGGSGQYVGGSGDYNPSSNPTPPKPKKTDKCGTVSHPDTYINEYDACTYRGSNGASVAGEVVFSVVYENAGNRQFPEGHIDCCSRTGVCQPADTIDNNHSDYGAYTLWSIVVDGFCYLGAK